MRQPSVACSRLRLVLLLLLLAAVAYPAHALEVAPPAVPPAHPLLLATSAIETTDLPAADTPVRIPLPVIRAAGTLEWRGREFDVSGITVTAPDQSCGEEPAAWLCGTVALTALRRFVRRKTLECSPVPSADGGRPRATCTLAGQDLGDWLVKHGWAKADGATHAEAESEAREAERGIWSPLRPGITGGGLGSAAAGVGPHDKGEGEAAVRIVVDISDQRLTLIHRDRVVARWPVSTARRGKITPTGQWRAKWLSRHHRSSLYNNAPMPYSVFYNGDYAIHGTDAIGRLGAPASAGCVRLHPNHAAVVFDLAQREGVASTLIVITH